MLLADLLLAIHFAFVAFVIAGFVLIWVGYFARWPFAHNFRFRVIHLSAMGFVLLEALIGMVCPLTVWENQLRQRGGAGGYQESFIQHWVGRILFYDLSETTFTIIYAVFFLLIALTLWIVPPRRAKRSSHPS